MGRKLSASEQAELAALDAADAEDALKAQSAPMQAQAPAAAAPAPMDQAAPLGAPPAPFAAPAPQVAPAAPEQPGMISRALGAGGSFIGGMAQGVGELRRSVDTALQPDAGQPVERFAPGGTARDVNRPFKNALRGAGRLAEGVATFIPDVAARTAAGIAGPVEYQRPDGTTGVREPGAADYGKRLVRGALVDAPLAAAHMVVDPMAKLAADLLPGGVEKTPGGFALRWNPNRKGVNETFDENPQALVEELGVPLAGLAHGLAGRGESGAMEPGIVTRAGAGLLRLPLRLAKGGAGVLNTDLGGPSILGPMARSAFPTVAGAIDAARAPSPAEARLGSVDQLTQGGGGLSPEETRAAMTGGAQGLAPRVAEATEAARAGTRNPGAGALRLARLSTKGPQVQAGLDAQAATDAAALEQQVTQRQAEADFEQQQQAQASAEANRAAETQLEPSEILRQQGENVRRAIQEGRSAAALQELDTLMKQQMGGESQPAANGPPPAPDTAAGEPAGGRYNLRWRADQQAARSGAQRALPAAPERPMLPPAQRVAWRDEPLPDAPAPETAALPAAAERRALPPGQGELPQLPPSEVPRPRDPTGQRPDVYEVPRGGFGAADPFGDAALAEQRAQAVRDHQAREAAAARDRAFRGPGYTGTENLERTTPRLTGDQAPPFVEGAKSAWPRLAEKPGAKFPKLADESAPEPAQEPRPFQQAPARPGRKGPQKVEGPADYRAGRKMAETLIEDPQAPIPEAASDEFYRGLQEKAAELESKINRKLELKVKLKKLSHKRTPAK